MLASINARGALGGISDVVSDKFGNQYSVRLFAVPLRRERAVSALGMISPPRAQLAGTEGADKPVGRRTAGAWEAVRDGE